MKHNQWITYHVTDTWNHCTVESILKGPLLLSNRMINRLTRRRGVRLNGRTTWLKRTVKKGDRLQVAVRPREQADLMPEPVPFTVKYEDMDWMVVDKPAGIKVHPVHSDEKGTLAHGILHYWKSQGWEGKVRPIHRLDRHTSGVLMVAKSAYAHQLMDRELREKRLKRVYLAILQGAPTPSLPLEGTIDAPIARQPGHSLKRCVSSKGDSAITHYRILDHNDQATLVQVELETGRTHQIRVHFAHFGLPLFGDSLYGGKSSLIGRQALHASELHFHHPFTEKDVKVISPPPDDFLQLARQLKFSLTEAWC
ncbi:RluA family pseudouridine synthase [Melghirimyces algeriensis]|uniref:Pseudouridine synthase n=1 Tax=Melghirimyces algeriensis TaxID=910412 RepID=A0A521EL16_9BACL|nr:RluA family pseudouridine synthase [Melghirimyces algeriensis]SMO84606.1 tRNA pseudouridine32 synthase / 23S rRNA pseudouridine746 synthase/23S rRNA pseudouridine1911/1915/1917 synthase [Melghirimyces algeriensis]